MEDHLGGSTHGPIPRHQRCHDEAMVEMLGELFPYAIGVALSPLPLIAVLLVLRSLAGRAAGAAFLAARLVVILAVAAIAALVADFLPESNGVSATGAAIRILLGTVLMVWAATKLIQRSKAAAEPSPPQWVAALEGTTTLGAARWGVILSAANIKELAFGIGAGVTIGSAAIGIGPTIAAAAIYAILACMGVILAVGAFWVAADRVREPLDRARTWLISNNTVILGAVLLIIGAMLIGHGLSAL